MQRKTVGVSNGTAADPTCIGSKACACAAASGSGLLGGPFVGF